MKVIFETTVTVLDEREEEGILQVIYEDDTVTFCLDGKELFSAGWDCNLKEIFEKIVIMNS